MFNHGKMKQLKVELLKLALTRKSYGKIHCIIYLLL